MRSRAMSRMLVAATLLGLVSRARAEAPRSIGKAEAMALARAEGPGVAIANAPAGAFGAAADAARAPLALPPRLTLSYGHRYGSLGSGAEASALAMVDVPLRAVGSAREGLASSLLLVTDLDVQRAKSDAMLRAAFAWARALEAKEVLRLRGAGLDEVRAIADIAKKRSAAGTSDELELALARADVGVAEAGTLDAEGTLVDAAAELRLATGIAANAPIEPVGDLYQVKDDSIDEATAVAAAEAHDPTLRVATARASAARSEIAVVKAAQAPVIGFGLSFTRDGFGDRVWSGVISIPIPMVDPTRFDASRAAASADVAVAQLAGVRAEIAKEVRVALHDRKHAREVRDKLRDDALAPLTKALAIARTQYAAGTRDVVLVLNVRQRLHSVEEQYVRACADVIRADLRLARRMGTLGG